MSNINLRSDPRPPQLFRASDRTQESLHLGVTCFGGKVTISDSCDVFEPHLLHPRYFVELSINAGLSHGDWRGIKWDDFQNILTTNNNH